jgi:hypothetical protein
VHDVIADVNDWPQLGHYTVVSMAFDADMQPVAFTLQQHHGIRTYLCGRDVPVYAWIVRGAQSDHTTLAQSWVHCTLPGIILQ